MTIGGQNLNSRFQVCGAKPFNAMFIDARRRKDDRPWDETNEIITKNTPTYGFLCIQKNNIPFGKLCSDYKVREDTRPTADNHRLYLRLLIQPNPYEKIFKCSHRQTLSPAPSPSLAIWISKIISTRGSIADVRLTSCLTSLDLSKQVNLLLIQYKQSSWIKIK